MNHESEAIGSTQTSTLISKAESGYGMFADPIFWARHCLQYSFFRDSHLELTSR